MFPLIGKWYSLLPNKYREIEGIKDGFNSSHAYSVALDCLYGAYLKVNYPLEYYTETLNIYSEKIDMQAYLIEELPYFNIKLKGLEFGRSTGAYNFNREENAIYKGIGTIKFLNNQVAENLQNYYDNEYNTDKTIIEVFRDIIEGKIADNRQMNILIKLGYFDSLGESNLLLELYNTMTGYQGKKALPSFLKFVGNPKIGLKYSTTLKSKDERLLNLENYCSFLIKNNIVKKYSIFDRLNAEMEYFGYPFSTVDDVSDNTYAVIDINSKYTPYLKLYNLKNGKDLSAKIDKKLAYDDGGNLLVNNGDIIEVLEVENRPKLQYIDGKWEKNVNILQVYLNKIRILNSSDI